MKMLGDKIDLLKQRKTGVKQTSIKSVLVTFKDGSSHSLSGSNSFFKQWYKSQRKKEWKRKLKGTIV